MLKCSWHSQLPFHAKLFFWTKMIEGLPLGLELTRKELRSSKCSFCSIPLEDSTHEFINAILVVSSRSIYHRFGKFWPVVIWGVYSRYLLNIFKMVQMRRWRSYSNSCANYNIIRICVMLSCLMVDMELKHILGSWKVSLCGTFGCWGMRESFTQGWVNFSFFMALDNVVLP